MVDLRADGSADFAAQIVSKGYVAADRAAGPPLGVFIGRQEGADTSYIYQDGSAEFASGKCKILNIGTIDAGEPNSATEGGTRVSAAGQLVVNVRGGI